MAEKARPPHLTVLPLPAINTCSLHCRCPLNVCCVALQLCITQFCLPATLPLVNNLLHDIVAEAYLPLRATYLQGLERLIWKGRSTKRLSVRPNMLTYLRSSSRFILCRYRVHPSSPTPPPCSHTLSSGTIPRSSLPSRYTSPLWPCATTPHSSVSASMP